MIAARSTRTIRRAYRDGRLRAYRDGNGHAVRIRYGDLRAWMTASSAAAPGPDGPDPGEPPPLARLDMGGRTPRSAPGENMTLLNAARARLRRGAAPADGAGPRPGGSAGASRA